MLSMDEKTRGDLARSASAMGKVIEAHSDNRDVVRKVVVQLPDWVQNPAIRQSVAQHWNDAGFVASVGADGLLIVDGVKEDVRH